MTTHTQDLTLVLGSTGKTGRRVVERLQARGIAALAENGLPPEFAELIRFLFTEVLDGRNTELTDGVQQALGREPRDFGAYARQAAASGVWSAENGRP